MRYLFDMITKYRFYFASSDLVYVYLPLLTRWLTPGALARFVPSSPLVFMMRYSSNKSFHLRQRSYSKYVFLVERTSVPLWKPESVSESGIYHLNESPLANFPLEGTIASHCANQMPANFARTNQRPEKTRSASSSFVPSHSPIAVLRLVTSCPRVC